MTDLTTSYPLLTLVPPVWAPAQAATPLASSSTVKTGTAQRPASERLRAAGVAAVFTPKDFELTELLARVAELAASRVQPA